MSQAIVLATRNPDKIREIQKFMRGFDFELITLESFPDAPDVIEDGKTLEENAAKKAGVIAEYTKLPAIADDTGLEVDYLDGAPGVYSSRYAGANATYADNVKKLLQDLTGIPVKKRSARFRCIVALATGGNTQLVEGVCEGIISEHPLGTGGFGYDPVFYVPEQNRTFAEMGLDFKNKISHRARALLKLRNLLESKEFNFGFRI